MTRRSDADREGFLARWSRRKRAVWEAGPDIESAADTVAAATGAAEPAALPADDGVDEAALSDRELLARYALPDPDTLTAADDVAAFMRAGVPGRLRTLALRRLWRLDPVLANLDGLVEYNDDYTDAAFVIPDMKTLYQVGRGGAAHLEDAAERLRAAGEAATSSETPPDGSSEPDAVPEAEPEAGDPPAAPEPPAGLAAATDRESVPLPDTAAAPEPPQRRRHMVFATPAAGPGGTGGPA